MVMSKSMVAKMTVIDDRCYLTLCWCGKYSWSATVEALGETDWTAMRYP